MTEYMAMSLLQTHENTWLVLSGATLEERHPSIVPRHFRLGKRMQIIGPVNVRFVHGSNNLDWTL